MLLLDQQQVDSAQVRNRQALDLLEELATPALSLGLELANVHSLRCQMLVAGRTREAETECQRSFVILNQLARTEAVRNRPEFQRLSRDLGYNYLDVARQALASDRALAERALTQLSSLLQDIVEPDRSTLVKYLSRVTATDAVI